MKRDFDLDPAAASRAGMFVRAGAVTADGGYVEPRRAASVVLLRDGESGPEVYLMRRPVTMEFAPGMSVFPGGGVDPRDQDGGGPADEHHGVWVGPSVRQWAGALGVESWLAAAVVRAAVRELFEECGVLLAGQHDKDVVNDSGVDDARMRKVLAGGGLSLTEFLSLRNFVLRTDLLKPWSRWCTPRFEPRRYDTWFFLAALPPGQYPDYAPQEADEGRWWGAADAARAAAEGTLAMMPPTIATIEEVAAAPDVGTLFAMQRVVSRVEPWLVQSTLGLRVRVDLNGRGGGESGPSTGFEVRV
ncbi:MAG: NUDIX hydrolase [Actinomycetota bacterium]